MALLNVTYSAQNYEPQNAISRYSLGQQTELFAHLHGLGAAAGA